MSVYDDPRDDGDDYRLACADARHDDVAVPWCKANGVKLVSEDTIGFQYDQPFRSGDFVTTYRGFTTWGAARNDLAATACGKINPS